MIRLASLKIRSGQVGRMEAALRVLNQGNMVEGVIQETEMKKGIHTYYGAGYVV